MNNLVTSLLEMAKFIDNAIKHCYVNGDINVNLKKEKKNIILEVTNKGKEIPNDFFS